MKFRDLVSTEEGFQVVKNLVDTLIQDAQVYILSLFIHVVVVVVVVTFSLQTQPFQLSLTFSLIL
jgi:hypothetical protein